MPTQHTQEGHDIKSEAIKTARAGGHLCGECKGYGEIRYRQSWDFSPKEPHGYVWFKCGACGGTGIERNKQLGEWKDYEFDEVLDLVHGEYHTEIEQGICKQCVESIERHNGYIKELIASHRTKLLEELRGKVKEYVAMCEDSTTEEYKLTKQIFGHQTVLDMNQVVRNLAAYLLKLLTSPKNPSEEPPTKGE